jgi:predicted RNA-binding Zn-ribbon protein involved in translation (DUF1610 family)
MAHLPCCNLHPDCRMVQTVVLVHNSIAAIETFEAYQCRRMHCTRHYTAGRGYFDITDPACQYVEDSTATNHSCPHHGETLFVRWSDDGYGYVYECPVADCGFTEPLHPIGRAEKYLVVSAGA